MGGFGPDQQLLHIPTQEQIDAAKAQTGLSHLKVVNEAHRNYLQKTLPDLYVDLYRWRRVRRRSSGSINGAGRIARYLVSVGGALNSRGMNAEGHPWRVAIQKPTDRENAGAGDCRH